jgi:hypothetical protein
MEVGITPAGNLVVAHLAMQLMSKSLVAVVNSGPILKEDLHQTVDRVLAAA